MDTPPDAGFPGTLVVAVPHMDDETLACGGMIARCSKKERIHVVYATDGARSPVPPFPWMGPPPVDLRALRLQEARAAADVLGVPAHNLHTLGLPDGRLHDHEATLRQELSALVQRLRPSYLFIPFRYDRHPDHLALHAAGLHAASALDVSPQIVEYFVYYRWRLIPGGDVRRLIAPEHLVHVDIGEQRGLKRRALACYTSQTTCLAPWQERPILPPERLDDVSEAPELFLRRDPRFPGSTVLSRFCTWVPVVHRLEPVLKTLKDRLRLLLRPATYRYRR